MTLWKLDPWNSLHRLRCSHTSIDRRWWRWWRWRWWRRRRRTGRKSFLRLRFRKGLFLLKEWWEKVLAFVDYCHFQPKDEKVKRKSTVCFLFISVKLFIYSSFSDKISFSFFILLKKIIIFEKVVKRKWYIKK